MEYATKNELNRLRCIIKSSTVEVSVNEIQISDCKNLFDILTYNFCPEPRTLFQYATEQEKMPQIIFKKIEEAKLVTYN